MNREKREK
jgi:hypothetical protein